MIGGATSQEEFLIPTRKVVEGGGQGCRVVTLVLGRLGVKRLLTDEKETRASPCKKGNFHVWE